MTDGATQATLVVGNDDTNTIFSGILENGTSFLQLIKLGTGTWTLTGWPATIPTLAGTIVNAGTLQAGSLNGFSKNSEFTVNSVLDLNGFNSTIGSLSGNGTDLDNGAGAAALTVGNDHADSTFHGVLEDGTGVLQLIKEGWAL